MNETLWAISLFMTSFRMGPKKVILSNLFETYRSINNIPNYQSLQNKDFEIGIFVQKALNGRM